MEEQIRSFKASTTAHNAVQLLLSCDQNEETPTRAQYDSVCDYFMTIISLENKSPPDVIANMTMDNFSDAVLEEGYHAIKVKNLKGYGTQGPFFLQQDFYNHVGIFIRRMRNKTQNPEEESVFLTWEGFAMSPSQVAQRINSCWAREFGNDVPISCDIPKKTTVTVEHCRRM